MIVRIFFVLWLSLISLLQAAAPGPHYRFYSRKELEAVSALGDSYEIYATKDGLLTNELKEGSSTPTHTFVEITRENGTSIFKKLIGIEILLAALRWNRPLETLKRITRLHCLDINTADHVKRITPLHAAVGAGQADVVEWLVNEEGAYVNPLDGDLKLPMDYLPDPAKGHCSKETVQYILALLTHPDALRYGGD